jgi:phage terminase Nu1 subunit (DNA packaging protein)
VDFEVEREMSAVFLTKQEVADTLHVSSRQVERLEKEGLPFIPTGKRKKVYSLESVMNWLKSREKCLSLKTKKDTGMSTYASTGSAFTDACQRAEQRQKQKLSRLK